MTQLKQGDKAPLFISQDQHGKEIALAKLKGKKVVLYFYPKDNTPGCTAQACNLKYNYTDLLKNGYVVLGVSADSLASHQKFTKKHNLPFSLLLDTEKNIINDYGVWGEKKFMGKTYQGINRTTFIINENGYIENIITKVETKKHTAQILV